MFGDNIPLENLPEKIPLNVVEREPVPTRVLNPNASEASYKPKQRSYRKTKQKKLAGKKPVEKKRAEKNQRGKNRCGKDLAGKRPRGDKKVP